MPGRKLLEQVSDVARLRHLSLRTEPAYLTSKKRYILSSQTAPERSPGGACARAVSLIWRCSEGGRGNTEPGLSRGSGRGDKSESRDLTLLILHKSVMMLLVNPSLAHQR